MEREKKRSGKPRIQISVNEIA